MPNSKRKQPSKVRKRKSTPLVSLQGGDGAHYTPLPEGKWLRSRLSGGAWKHKILSQPSMPLSGPGGPQLSLRTCPDGAEYIKLGDGSYMRYTRRSDNSWAQDNVPASK